ncbi:MAG: phosphohydrolase [Candidatus Aminicenantia bacterium]
MITLKALSEHPQVKAFIEKSNHYLGEIGYTEHGVRHAKLTAKNASFILKELDYSAQDQELAAMAGYVHDMANFLGRKNHPQSCAILIFHILSSLGMDEKEIALIMNAISNHEEEDGVPTDPISAALIIADKSDVHRSRIRTTKFINFDLHDRVNYAAKQSKILVDKRNQIISLNLEIDPEISQVMDYFEIFLSRMLACRKASNVFNCQFQLIINGVRL